MQYVSKYVGAAAYTPIPNNGNMTIANGAQLKLVSVILAELAQKPVRINEVCLVSYQPAYRIY